MWPISRLRFHVKINPVKSEIRGISEDTSVSFVPMEAVGEYGGLRLEQTHALEDVTNGYTYFRDGDVVVAKITPCFENGKGSIADGLENGIGFGTTELHVLRPSSFMDRNYLFYLTISHAFRKIGASYMYGAGGQKRVPDSFIRDFLHPIPTTEEQRAIAAFLDRETARIDALIEKKRRQIELLQEKRSALISHAVTKGLDPNAPMKDSGIEWLGEIPEHWDLPPLYARYSVELGKMLDAKRITGEFLLPYLRNIDVQWDRVNVENLPEMDIAPDEYNRFTLTEGDLVICEGGEVGRTAMWHGELQVCAFQKAIHRVRPRSLRDVQRFFYYVMRTAAGSGVFLAYGNPNTIPHLTAEKLRVYRFPFPPRDEQQRIVAHLDRETARIDALVDKVIESIDGLREYRTTLISAAVTGKIDVRKEVD